jgi:hypothetical protein
MWTNTTAENLRAELGRLYGLIELYVNVNPKKWLETGIDLRRVETALARVTIGRVR